MERRLTVDTAFNLAAFGVMAVSGVLLNLLILGRAGDAALGVFNQVYAVYVIGSQVAVFGLHDAVHVQVASHPDAAERRAIVGGGLLGAGLIGAPVALAVWLLAPLAGAFAGSDAVGEGLRWLAPGLLLFAMNKVGMSALAGAGRLRTFAVVQIVRILTLFGTTAGLAWIGRDASELALGFVAAEVVILPVLLALVPIGAPGGWTRTLLGFGARAVPHGLISESFLRVDILMLAPFVSDGQIGIYSLAAMFAEGMTQVGGTLRTVIGPRMVPLLLPGADPRARARLLRQGMGLGLGAMAALAVGLALAFPALGFVLDPVVVDGAHDVLLVLAVGLVAYGAFFPVDGALLWAGRPGGQSTLMATNIVVNVALNLALIPAWGIGGAAVATALAWGFSACSLQVATRVGLGMRGGLVGEALRNGPT